MALAGTILTVDAQAPMAIYAQITGPGQIVKRGSESLIVSNASVGLIVEAGTVIANSAVGLVTLNGGRVESGGRFSGIDGSGGVIAPRPYYSIDSGPYFLEVHGDVCDEPSIRTRYFAWRTSTGKPVLATEGVRRHRSGRSLAEVVGVSGPSPEVVLRLVDATGGVSGVFAQGTQSRWAAKLYDIVYTPNAVTSSRRPPVSGVVSAMTTSGRIRQTGSATPLRSRAIAFCFRRHWFHGSRSYPRRVLMTFHRTRRPAPDAGPYRYAIVESGAPMIPSPDDPIAEIA